MNILLNIPDEIVGRYQSEAEKEKRSRKNLMEKVLIDYFQSPKTQIQDLTKSTNDVKPFEQPKTNYFINTPEPPKVSPMEFYYAEIKEAGSIEQIKTIVATFKKDQSLAGWQKQSLEKYAIEMSKHFEF